MIPFYNPNATDPPDPEYYICPVCGAELNYGSEVFVDEDGDIIGCEECVRRKYAEDVL